MEKLNALEDVQKAKVANELYVNSIQSKNKTEANKNNHNKRNIVKCYNCRKRNHYSCRFPKQCLNFKSPDHYLRECNEKRK